MPIVFEVYNSEGDCIKLPPREPSSARTETRGRRFERLGTRQRQAQAKWKALHLRNRGARAGRG